LIKEEHEPAESYKSFGEADEEWISRVTGINCKPLDWDLTLELNESVVDPSRKFQKHFEEAVQAFHMGTEAGRRILLNLFLLDIIMLPEFNHTLRIFPEIEMSASTTGLKKRKLNGKTD
jgi:hypothetical protein